MTVGFASVDFAARPDSSASDLTFLARHPSGRPLKIAIYLNDLSGGGAERMTLTLIDEFRRAGAEIELLLHSAQGELAASRPTGTPILAFETSGVARDIVPIARYLRRARPDVLLSSLNHNNVVAALGAALAGRRVPVIVTQHAALSQEVAHNGHWKYTVMPMAYRAASRLIDGFVAVSAGVADDMARISGVDRARLTVIYNPAIDRELPVRAEQACDHPWFDDAAIPVFVTAGRLVHQKDHATLLRAFAIYRRDRPGRLMILGTGPLLGECVSLAEALGIARDVAFVGFVKNPLPYYRKAAAFVLSSRFEGFGLVLAEAMACGLPTISTDCPYGPSEILADGKFGSLVPMADPAALAAALDPALRDRFPASEMRARAAAFGAETATRQYLELMQAILARRSVG